jgi:hypothetical protein
MQPECIRIIAWNPCSLALSPDVGCVVMKATCTALIACTFTRAVVMSDPHRPTSWDYTVRKEETMDEMEMVFLKDFWELMDAAHYSCLSEVEWLAVKQERLLLDMPLRMNWDHMETRLLARFFSRNTMRSEGLFRCAAHACWNRAHCRCCVAGPWLSVCCALCTARRCCLAV